MNILSLFDGMSCGQIALERAGIKVDRYYASELDKYAIKVTQSNWPETVQLGDVTRWREWNIDWSSIDLLIGGSPCQGFSFAGKQLAFNDPRSKLFFEYSNILNHIRSINPNVKFLLENTKMKQLYINIVDEFLGVKSVKINSNLVSAQNRDRHYWCNWFIDLLYDKDIVLKDILQNIEELPTNINYKNKSKCLRVGGAGSKLGDKHEWDSPYCILTPRGNNKGGVRGVNGKTPCLTSSSWEYNVHVFDTINKRRFTPVECERLQTVPDNYTNHVSNTQRYKMLGNGWTVDVIAHIFKSL